MWENAAPMPPPQATSLRQKRKYPPKTDGDFVLWGQLGLSLVILAVITLAYLLNWPFLPDVRVAFRKAMQPEQKIFLSEERTFSKFTEKAVQTLSGAIENVLLPNSNPATSETALRQGHTKTQPIPSGARQESYLPGFSLKFPLAGYNCSYTSGYGWRTDPMGGSGSDFHLGNDLAAAEGTLVQAAADGVVRYTGVHSSYGNYVRILHSDGDETLYAHLQYVFVHTGQQVSAGETLGTVGETGNTTGPHLHFELLHRGIRYDPSEALQNAS